MKNRLKHIYLLLYIFPFKLAYLCLSQCKDALSTRQKLIAQDYKVSYSLAKACKPDLRKYRCNMDTAMPRAREAKLSYLLLCLEAAVHRGEALMPCGRTQVLPPTVLVSTCLRSFCRRANGERRVSGRDAGLQADADGRLLAQSRDRAALQRGD